MLACAYGGGEAPQPRRVLMNRLSLIFPPLPSHLFTFLRFTKIVFLILTRIAQDL
jgi:hypothetical protein